MFQIKLILNKHYWSSALDYLQLARACGVPVGRRSGGRLATKLVATINVIIAKLSSSWQVQYQSNWELRLVLISV